MLNEKEHVKWAMMRTSSIDMVRGMLYRAFGIDYVEVCEATIDDLNGNTIDEIYVLEFDATNYQVEALKRVLKLENVRGYLM